MENGVRKLVERMLASLEDDGYGRKTRAAYKRTWGGFASWCEKRAISQAGEEAARGYIEEMGWPTEGRSQAAREARAVLRLVASEGGDRLLTRLPGTPAEVPGVFMGLYESYGENLNGGPVSEGTVRRRLCRIRPFLRHLSDCGVADAAEVTAEHVIAYAGELSSLPSSSRAASLRELRAFLRFAADGWGMRAGLSELYPKVLVDCDDVLPSTFTQDELRAVVEAARSASGPCSKRNLAVVLLAVTTGMRSGDVRDLTFDQVSWHDRVIRFAQGKTGAPVALPITEDCMLALADYVKSERPESDDPHVFLRARAPHVPYSRHYSFHHVVAGLVSAAGIEVGSRHHGMHSLRHSAAVNLLGSGATYPVLSGILGHECANTTKRYLRVDVEALRAMCLEVPYA